MMTQAPLAARKNLKLEAMTIGNPIGAGGPIRSPISLTPR
jgi:hypothetical protein